MRDIGGVHGKRQQGAMGEVDDVQHAINQREAQSHQPIDRPHQKAVCHGLQQNFGRVAHLSR